MKKLLFTLFLVLFTTTCFAAATVAGRIETPATSASTTLTANFTQTTGNLVVIFISTAQSTALSSITNSFTNLTNLTGNFHIIYKVLTGSEGGSVSMTVTSTKYACIAYNIQGFSGTPEYSTVATGTSTGPDPSTVTPAGGSNTYLWLAAFYMAGEEADDDTWCNSAPTSFGTLTQSTTGIGGVASTNCEVASADYTSTASSMNPDAFNTDVSLAWRAYTVAISPAIFVPKQQNWRVYKDDGAEPTTAYAAENTGGTLDGRTDIIRVRVAIAETAAVAGTLTDIDIQYSTNDADFTAMGAGNAWNYANGQATNGATLSGVKLTDSGIVVGIYCEDQTNDPALSASQVKEFDFAIAPTTTVASNTLYYFRIVYNSGPTVIALNSGKTHPQMTTRALRTISDAGGNWSTNGAWVEGSPPDSTMIVTTQSDGTSGAVTIDTTANCKEADFTYYTATLTHTAGITWNIYGGLKLVAGMTYAPAADTCAIVIQGTGSIYTGGKSLGNFTVTGSGITVTLQDSFTMRATSTTLTLTQGTLNTNGQTLAIGKLASSIDTYARTLTLGASQVTCSGTGVSWNCATIAPNLTLNANTSIIILSGANIEFSGAAKTYNTIQITGSGGNYISGANTFANLTRTGTAVKTDGLILNANQTITGTLTLNGNSSINRLLIYSNTLGTQRTLTAATVSVTNADFQDIIGAGAGSWDLSAISGLSGDCGGNSGITFTTGATQTWTNVNGGNWSDVANWSSRVPLPQDDVSFNCAFGASKTVTADMPRLGKSIDWTGATWTTALTWSKSGTHASYGSITLISGLTYNGGGTNCYLQGRGSYNITTCGVALSGGIFIQSVGGTYTLQDDLNTNYLLQLNNGTLNANNKNVICYYFNSSNSNTRTLTMGSGNWTLGTTLLSGITAWNLATTTGLTFNKDTATIILNSTSSSYGSNFAGGGLTYNNLSITGGGTGVIEFTESNTFNNFTINKPKEVNFTSGTTQTFNGSFAALGDVSNVITIHAVTPASAATLTKNYTGASWYVGANSTLVSGCTGLTVGVSPEGNIDYCTITDITGIAAGGDVYSSRGIGRGIGRGIFR